MSNPFKKKDNEQPRQSLLDRILRQGTQTPGPQLPIIQPTNSNNGQRNNNGTQQKKEEKKESPKQKSENVNPQQNSTQIKPSSQDMKKQSPKLFVNPFSVHHPATTEQNKIIPLPQQLLLVKIVAKNGAGLGSFKMDRSIILQKQKKDVKINEIKIEEGYKKQLMKMWEMIKEGKKILDVFIMATNLAILTNSQKNPHSPMPNNLIRRLKQGMEFYQYQPPRQATMAKLLQQNIETNTNVVLCQQIQKVRNKCKTDKFIGLYCILQNPRYLESGVDLPSFLMQDKIYLIRLYQHLSRTSRLSSRKVINLEEQLKILRQLVNYFHKIFMANEKNSNQKLDTIIELGRQIIRLFFIILIDNSAEVKAQQLVNQFLPMLQTLKVIEKKNSTIKSFLNNFEFHLLLKWNNHLQHIQMGCIQTFVQYYSSQKQMQAKQLKLTMITLSQITVYDDKMCEMMERKQRRFIQINRQVLQKRINKNKMISIGIQCILLIKQSNKTNQKLFVEQLMKLLYHVCPVSIMGFNSDNYTNLELVLPFISRYYKKSASNQSQYATIGQINQFLHEPYKFESSSDNFIIAKYIMSVLKHVEANEFNNLIQKKHKLSVLEQALKQFNVSTLLNNTEIYPLFLVRLLCKYITNYTEEYYYRGDSLSKQQKKDTKSKRIEQIKKLMLMIYQTMDAIIQYSIKQHEFNKNSNTQKYMIGYQNILLNLLPLANLMGCSGLLPTSDKKVIVQTSTNAVIGVNQADIPQNYHKIMQKLYKSYTTQSTPTINGQNVKIISQHINSSIKVCIEWQQKIKQKQKINNYLVYLLTVEYMYKISKDTQLQPNLLFMRKYITYQHILQYVLQICIKNRNFSSNLWYLISTTLLLLPKMFFSHQFNNTNLDPNLLNLLVNNKQTIISLCLNRVSAKQYLPNELHEKISYLQLIRQLLRISQVETQLTNSKKSFMQSRSKQDKYTSETMPNDWAKEIIKKTLIIKRQNNQNIQASKILVVVTQIGFKYDSQTYDIIVDEDYKDEIISSIFILLAYYLNKVPSKTKNYGSDHESQLDICAWNIRCMNLFQNMFNYPPSIRITIDKAHTLAQTCLKIIKSKSLKIKANASEIINWIQILLPMIHKNIKSVKIYEVLLEQSILFLCEQKDKRQHRNQIKKEKKQKRQHFKLVQLIMVYMSNEHRISQLFQNSNLLEKVLRSLMVILDNVFTLFMVQNTTYFKLSQLQTWYKTAVISLVKISQFINIYHLILTQKNQKISDSLLAACKKMKLTLEQSLKSHPLLDMSAAKQQNIKQMILCSFQILSFGNEDKRQSQTKIYFNQALINVSMGNKQSFQSFFLHLAKQAIDTRAIYREKQEHKSKQNKNYQLQVDENKYRSYYLIYYFINKILTSHDQNHRIYFMFNTQTNKIDKQINQSLKRLLNHMIQPIYIQDMNQNLWFLVLVHRVVKLDPSILQKKSVLCDILQFCCRTIECLLQIKQKKNTKKNTRHHERFSLLEQNREIIYFQDWLVFVQVLGIACLVLRTCAHSSLKEGQNCLSFIRNFVFQKIKKILMTWDNFQQNDKTKLIFFPISSQLNTNPSTKQTFAKYINQNLKEKQKQKKSDSKQLIEEKQVTVQNYIKSTMMLSNVALIMNLIKHDILFLFGSQKDVKQKFMEFVQQVLGSFRTFYDNYFQIGQISQKNQQIISTNLDQYIKDPISTKNNCYLNKILRQYWLIPVQATSTQKLLKKQISRIIDQKSEQLSAILWYNNIEDILTSLGYKPSNKFITKSAISNSIMRGNSRNGSSMRLA